MHARDSLLTELDCTCVSQLHVPPPETTCQLTLVSGWSLSEGRLTLKPPDLPQAQQCQGGVDVK